LRRITEDWDNAGKRYADRGGNRDDRDSKSSVDGHSVVPLSLNRAHPSMDLADPEFNEVAGLKVSLVFNPASAEELFAGSGHTSPKLRRWGATASRCPISISAFL